MGRVSKWHLSKCELTQYCRPLLDKPETIPFTIIIRMLQALMPRFVQGPPTLDVDVYGSLDLNPGFVSNTGGGNTQGINPQIFLS